MGSSILSSGPRLFDISPSLLSFAPIPLLSFCKEMQNSGGGWGQTAVSPAKIPTGRDFYPATFAQDKEVGTRVFFPDFPTTNAMNFPSY